MSTGFDKCIASGGKVISKSLGNGKYIHICTLNGISYHGEIKRRQKQKRASFEEAMKQIYREKK